MRMHIFPYICPLINYPFDIFDRTFLLVRIALRRGGICADFSVIQSSASKISGKSLVCPTHIEIFVAIDHLFLITFTHFEVYKEQDRKAGGRVYARQFCVVEICIQKD